MGDVTSPSSTRLSLAERSPPMRQSSPFVEDFKDALQNQADLSEDPVLDEKFQNLLEPYEGLHGTLGRLPRGETHKALPTPRVLYLAQQIGNLATAIAGLLRDKMVKTLVDGSQELRECISLLHPAPSGIRQHIRTCFLKQVSQPETVSWWFTNLAMLAQAEARSDVPLPSAPLKADFRKSFVGDAADNLRNHILKISGQNDTYAPVVAVVQSSGSGKTRTVLELAKKELGFYICVRPDPAPKQYLSLPPADKGVREFLTCPGPELDTTLRMACWLKAFVEEFHKVCAAEMSASRPGQQSHAALVAAVASKLKHDLTTVAAHQDDASQSSPPPENFRESFLQSIVEQADRYFDTMDTFVTEHNRKQDKKQRQWLRNPLLDQEQEFKPDPIELGLAKWMSSSFQALLRVLPKDQAGFIFFAIDEAMTLEGSRSGATTGLVSLRRLLSHLPPCKNRFWVILLDTSNEIGSLTGKAATKRSIRLHQGALQLPAPFTDLPQDVFLRVTKQRYIDILAGARSVTNRDLLDLLPEMGRPLWADQVFKYDLNLQRPAPHINGIFLEHIHLKLVGREADSREIAEAAQRIPLNIIGSAGKTTESGFLSKQISHHLRVIANYTPFAVTSWAPSEPLLSLSVASAFRISDPLQKWSEIIVEVADSHHNTNLLVGENGEEFARIMISCAIDQALRRGSVIDIHEDQGPCPRHLYPLRVDRFLKTLFGETTNFSEEAMVWGKCHYINATHFARLEKQFHAPNHFAPEGLLAQAWTRNVGILGISNQTGFDILLPAQRSKAEWSLDLPFDPESFDALCFQIKLKKNYNAPTSQWLYDQNTGIKAAEAVKDLNVYISLDAGKAEFSSPEPTPGSHPARDGPLGIYVGGSSAEQFPLIGHLTAEAQRCLPVFLSRTGSSADPETQSFLNMSMFVEQSRP